MSRSPRKLIISAGAIVLVIAVALVWRRENEPVYQGRTLSYWLDDYSRAVPFEHSAQQRARAAEAIRQMGPSILPSLFAWMEYETPPWRANAMKAAAKWDISFTKDLFGDKRAKRGDEAPYAFHCLGSVAKGAIPELARLLKSTNSHTAILAGVALGQLGSDSIPVLINELTNAAVGTPPQFQIVMAWCNLGTNARSALPVLFSLLNGSNEVAAATAALLLGLVPVEPKVVVPALSASLQSKNTQLRYRSVRALANFGKEALPAIPVLVSALDDPQQIVRDAATNAVIDIAPELLTIPPISK